MREVGGSIQEKLKDYLGNVLKCANSIVNEFFYYLEIIEKGEKADMESFILRDILNCLFMEDVPLHLDINMALEYYFRNQNSQELKGNEKAMLLKVDRSVIEATTQNRILNNLEKINK